MQKLILTKCKNYDETIHVVLCDYWFKYHGVYFSPIRTELDTIVFEVKGNNYQEKQKSVLELANHFIKFDLDSKQVFHHDYDYKRIKAFFVDMQGEF